MAGRQIEQIVGHVPVEALPLPGIEERNEAAARAFLDFVAEVHERTSVSVCLLGEETEEAGGDLFLGGPGQPAQLGDDHLQRRDAARAPALADLGEEVLRLVEQSPRRRLLIRSQPKLAGEGLPLHVYPATAAATWRG